MAPRKKGNPLRPEQETRISALQQELKEVDGKLKKVNHLNEAPKEDGIDAVGIVARMHKSSLSHQKTDLLSELAPIRNDFIQSIHHFTRRAYKELPQFCKFRLFKNQPQRITMKDKKGEYIRPITEPINFRGLVAEVTYYEGELGDTDRMVYLAILNEAIRHKDFVKQFGKIPFNLDELADKAGFSHASNQRREWVLQSLNRLQSTNLKFYHGAGNLTGQDHFHLIESHYSLEKSTFAGEVSEKIKGLELYPRDPFLLYMDKVKEQAEQLLAKFKPRTPRITLVKFNEPLTNAICSDEITTVDMWALQKLDRLSSRSLFLFLYDLSQWRNSKEPLELSLRELMELMDLTPNVQIKNGKKYIWWKYSVELVKEIFAEVNRVAQFIQYFDWLGEGEATVLKVRLSDEVLQMPPK
jgi:hypothetical protein